MTRYPEQTTEDSFRDFGSWLHGYVVSMVRQNTGRREGGSMGEEAELFTSWQPVGKEPRGRDQEQAISSKDTSPVTYLL